MTFSAKTRTENIEKLKRSNLELLIIGGGITGAGIALEAGSRGIAAGLIEMQDFSAGTSSRSTKLIHGGLRYLKQFEVEVVASVGQEREVIYNNASHIVKPTPMILPIYDEKGASFDSFSAKVALDLYDRLSEVQEEYKNYFLDKEEALKREPSLRKEGLQGAGVYLDYSSDDARLTIEIIKKAHEFGSILTNYVKAVDFIYGEDHQVSGVKAEDVLTGERFDIHAKIVINAAGPWSDEVRNKSEKEPEIRMRPTKGIHLTVDKERLPVNGPIYFDSGFQDNRMIFVIPRRNKTYFGTTDTDYQGNLEEPGISSEDITYLLKAVNNRFSGVELTASDIKSSWSGLRPLIQEADSKDPSAVSRGSTLTESNSGLLSIAGGKLTDYRKMAEGSLKLVTRRLREKTGKSYPEVETKVIRLSGANVPLGEDFERFVKEEAAKGVAIGVSEEEAEFLVRWYGSNSIDLFEQAKEKKNFADLTLAESLSLQYALESEMTLTPSDYFLRRTDYLLFNSEILAKIKEPVIQAMSEYYEWNQETKEQAAAELEEHIAASDLSKNS